MNDRKFSNIEKAKLLDSVYESVSVASHPSASLMSYFRSDPIRNWLFDRWDAGAWAELGCGLRSLLEYSEDFLAGGGALPLKDDLFGLDLSHVAIERALNSNNYKVHYAQADLSKEIPHGPYQVLIDGHFLHCLNSVPEVFQTLGMIREALCPGGIYIGEVMLAHKNLSFETQFEYDAESCVLYKGNHPSRIIMDAFEWEDMFLSSGLSIKYFVCQSSIKIIPEDDRDVAMNGDPECLRFCLERV